MYNGKWSPTNPNWFENKSISELQKKLKEANEFVDRCPQFEYGWHNEYRQELKRRIAESIGKSKK